MSRRSCVFSRRPQCITTQISRRVSLAAVYWQRARRHQARRLRAAPQHAHRSAARRGRARGGRAHRRRRDAACAARRHLQRRPVGDAPH
eukprot:5718184-Prymnesium_polylepis.1